MKQKKSELTKQRILEAAEAEFSEKGVFGARIDSIAVTYGFGKREDLEALGATFVVDSVGEIYALLGIDK